MEETAEILYEDIAGVIPCYNAGPRVRPVAEGALRYLKQVIVVDDGSTDGCVQALQDLCVTCTALAKNSGKGHAILAGLRAALAEPDVAAVCILDADGQHDPDEIPKLAAAFHEGADLVIGARIFDGDVPWRSRFGNKVTVTISAWLLGARLPDTQCGFRILSRRLTEAVVSQIEGGRYETEMQIVALAVKGGFNVTPVPIKTIYEEGNRSSHFHKVRDSFRIYASLLCAGLRKY